MNVQEAKDAISAAELARLEYDLEMGNPAFAVVPAQVNLVVGVYLEKISRLAVLNTLGKWATARFKPKETM